MSTPLPRKSRIPYLPGNHRLRHHVRKVNQNIKSNRIGAREIVICFFCVDYSVFFKLCNLALILYVVNLTKSDRMLIFFVRNYRVYEGLTHRYVHAEISKIKFRSP